MNYKTAKRFYFLVVFLSLALTVTLWIISSHTITIEYFAIHVLIILVGALWLKRKKNTVSISSVLK